MTDRPMTGEERERALRLADRIIDEAERDAEAGVMADHAFWPESSVVVARALLSTSAAVSGMREALEKYRDDYCEGWCKENGGAGRFNDCGGCPAAAVLSGIETEQKQARSPSALSAPASTLSKDTTK